MKNLKTKFTFVKTKKSDFFGIISGIKIKYKEKVLKLMSENIYMNYRIENRNFYKFKLRLSKRFLKVTWFQAAVAWESCFQLFQICESLAFSTFR